MFNRLALVAVAGLVAASVAIPAASGEEGDYFALTVDKTAYTSQFKTMLTVSGTYSCSVSFDVNPDFSGMGINVSQIQGKSRVVTGGSGYGGGAGEFICDGQTYPWSVSDVYANFGFEPATWKGGRATASISGGISSGPCEEGQQCQGVGADVTRVIQIR